MIRLALVLVLSLPLTLVMAAGGGSTASAEIAAPTKIDAHCRRDLHKTLSRLIRESVKELNKCHTKRLAGIVAAGTDCNEHLNSPSPNKKVREEDKLRRRADKSCAGGRRKPASEPAALGFVSCPAPCDGVAIDNDYANVAECMICLSDTLSKDLVTFVYGTPDVPPASGAKRCIDRIGNLVKKYISKRLKVQEQCQRDRDLGKIPLAIDCLVHDPRSVIVKARNNLIENIRRCGDAPIASLDSCGFDVDSEIACVIPAVENAVDVLFEASYPPIPDPAP